MRIAVVNWSSRRVGGVEDYVSLLIPALVRAGMSVAFWHEVDEPLGRGRIDSRSAVANFCAAEMGVDAALDALRHWKPDLIYVQQLQNLDIEAKLLDIAPSVLCLHNYVGTCISGGKTFTRPTAVPCAREFGWPCLVHYFPRGCGGNNPVTMWQLFREQSDRLRRMQRYQAIVTYTEHMCRELARHRLAARALPFPVEQPGRSAAHASNGTWRLLFAGRMEPLKGGALLIDAMPELVALAKRPVSVVMAGEGGDRLAWETRARAVQQKTPNLTFKFPGWLPSDQLGTLMANADLLVVPSVWPEPFGLVGPFAGQHGLPAAAFAVGGIPEWVTDGVSGHLAPGDPPTPAGLSRAIFECLENPVHHAALREGALKMAGRFTLGHHMPPLLHIFEQIVHPAALKTVLEQAVQAHRK